MKHMIVRYIIFIILILGFILYVKLGKKIVKDEKYCKKVKMYKIVLIYLFIWAILNSIPFENYFIKFKSIEDNLNYFFYKPEIKKKFVYDDYAYVKLTYKDKGKNIDCFMYLENKNGSWEFSNLLNCNQGFNFKKIDFNRFQIIELKNKNSIAIEVTTRIRDNKNEVSDSIDSKVYSYSDDNIFQDSIIIINKKINKEDYKIFINGKEYKPFKK